MTFGFKTILPLNLGGKVYKTAKKTIINDKKDGEPRMTDTASFAKALKFSSIKKVFDVDYLAHWKRRLVFRWPDWEEVL